MAKHLFMICPTDFIEPIVRKNFDGQKYFYTSLGNTFNVGQNSVDDLIAVVQKHEIEEITFIISEKNKIILDATQGQKFRNIRGLQHSYERINDKRNLSHQMWSSHEQHILFLSYYLSEKVNKLRKHLRANSLTMLAVNAKIYSQKYNSFRGIYPEISLSDPAGIN